MFVADEGQDMTDAFDRFWHVKEWLVDSPLDDPAELHYVVTRLSEEDRGDRRKVNEAVHDALLAQLALWTSPEDIVRLVLWRAAHTR